MDPNSPTTGRYRMAPRRDFFLGGLPEVVPRAQIPKAVEGVFAWLSETPLGMTDVLGVAIAHQELMLLTPFLQFTPAAVDALTTCLLSKRLLNRHGLAVVEQNFARDMDAYELALRDRSDGGRARWVRYFVIQLAAAMRAASSDVLKLRKHIQHEPWLDAAPLSAREELIYQRVLHARKTTSRQLLAALGQKASTLRMVQRDLARLAELGLVEKVGGRKDAYYRPLADLDRDEAPFPPLANQAISDREDAS